MRYLIISLALMLSACASAPVAPSAKLQRPAAWAMEDCRPQPDIPKDEGVNKAARTSYYSESRIAASQCREKHAALSAYARTITSDK